MLIKQCWCGNREFQKAESLSNYEVVECVRCGTVIQVLPEDFDLDRYYRETYHFGVYTHSFEQDFLAGKKRVERYRSSSFPFLVEPVLDVGAGNGGFVGACRVLGIEAYGQDLCASAGVSDIPLRLLQSKAFGTVTCHDAIEHVREPGEFFYALTKLTDWVVIEFPDFSYARHWKVNEHIWHFGVEQMLQLCSRHGFKVRDWFSPIEGKFTVVSGRK